jgi:anti-anti-sigma factor
MRRPNLFRITVEPLDEAQLIRASGELDMSTSPTLGHELQAARDGGITAVLDLSDVRFIDSTGLRVLLGASRDSAGSEWGFFIVRPSDVVQRLIALSRTADLLTLIDPARDRVLG